MITVSYLVEKSDVLALWSEYYASSPTVRRQYRWGQVGLGVLAAYNALNAFTGEETLSPVPLIVAVLLGLCAYFYPVWYMSKLRKNADSMISEAANRLVLGPSTLELREDG